MLSHCRLDFLRCILTVLSLSLLRTAVAAPPPTLEQIRGYAFPEGVVAAAHGSHVAWTVDDHGRRNVWVASAPGFEASQLTAYNSDDGQEITSLALSADGSNVVYVRGGEHGANWEGGLPANPTSQPGETKVEIWTVPFAGGTPRLLAEGDFPVVSPDGQRVAFLKDKAAWIASIGGTDAHRLFGSQGRVEQLQWSPDGSRLAFVSNRGSHSFIGVYSDEKTPLLWLAPSTTRDESPRWSGDGRQIVFTRSPGEGGAPHSPLEIQPAVWSIWSADAQTGAGKLLWSNSKTARDTFLDYLEWSATGRIVFLSYRDGWPHLYSLAPTGGEPLLLTPGEFAVEDVVISADRRSLIFNANTGSDPDDMDRRHLFSVSVDGGKPKALTSGSGIEWSPAALGDGRIAFITSDARRPPVLATLTKSGSVQRFAVNLVPANYPAEQLVVPKRITFQAKDGKVVHGQLFEPKTRGPNPAVVYMHGGPSRQMLLGWHYMGYYSNDYAVNQYLASRGYVVLVVNYRLGIGYGYDYQHPPTGGVRGAAEYQDIQAAGAYLKSLPRVDGARIGLYGGSYGGYLTAMGLSHDSDLFVVGVDIHGVHNWVEDYGLETLLARKRYERIPDAERALDIAWQSSPASAVSGWKSPVLLIHGDDDRNVRVTQSIDLIQRLDAAGVYNETLILPDETHSILRYANEIRMNQATADFLERYLSKRR